MKMMNMTTLARVMSVRMVTTDKKAIGFDHQCYAVYGCEYWDCAGAQSGVVLHL
jgi:hypothetical protein